MGACIVSGAQGAADDRPGGGTAVSCLCSWRSAMSSRQVLLSAFGNFREVAIFDDASPRDMVVKTFEDCEPIIERAKILSEMKPGKEFRHAAIIPQHVLDKA